MTNTLSEFTPHGAEPRPGFRYPLPIKSYSDYQTDKEKGLLCGRYVGDARLADEQPDLFKRTDDGFAVAVLGAPPFEDCSICGGSECSIELNTHLWIESTGYVSKLHQWHQDIRVDGLRTQLLGDYAKTQYELSLGSIEAALKVLADTDSIYVVDLVYGSKGDGSANTQVEKEVIYTVNYRSSTDKGKFIILYYVIYRHGAFMYAEVLEPAEFYEFSTVKHFLTHRPPPRTAACDF